MAVWNSWLFMAFAAPALWALANIIDVYFTKEVYKDEYDGVIISGLFHLAPWILLPIFGISFPEKIVTFLAFGAGIFFLLANWFYFRSMFAIGDASLIQTLWNSTAIVVPVLAFFLIGEKLATIHYVGIAITFAGLMILSLGDGITKRNISEILPDMAGAIVFFSLSMIAQERVYHHAGFWNGYLTFSLGVGTGGLIFLIVRIIQKRTGHLLKLNRDFAGWFLGAECLGLFGTVCSQRAISLTPAVSFVAVIEALMPAFIIGESLLIFVLCKIFRANGRKIVNKIHEGQVRGFGIKILAIAIMAAGIYLINLK
jgi:drug/metabolite transporter (DMT)-like permease